MQVDFAINVRKVVIVFLIYIDSCLKIKQRYLSKAKEGGVEDFRLKEN